MFQRPPSTSFLKSVDWKGYNRPLISLGKLRSGSLPVYCTAKSSSSNFTRNQTQSDPDCIGTRLVVEDDDDYHINEVKIMNKPPDDFLPCLLSGLLVTLGPSYLFP